LSVQVIEDGQDAEGLALGEGLTNGDGYGAEHWIIEALRRVVYQSRHSRRQCLERLHE
jgi:hypothetical protein